MRTGWRTSTPRGSCQLCFRNNILTAGVSPVLESPELVCCKTCKRHKTNKNPKSSKSRTFEFLLQKFVSLLCPDNSNSWLSASNENDETIKQHALFRNFAISRKQRNSSNSCDLVPASNIIGDPKAYHAYMLFVFSRRQAIPHDVENGERSIEHIVCLSPVVWHLYVTWFDMISLRLNRIFI